MSACSITLEKDKLPKIINKLEFLVFRALEKQGMHFSDLTGKERAENLRTLLDKVRTDVIPEYISEYTKQAASHKALGNIDDATEYEKFATNMQTLLTMWDKIVPNFIYYSNVFSVKSKFTLDAEGFVDMADVADDEEKMYKMMVFDQAANEMDPLDEVDKNVELYLRSLTMPDEVDDYGFTVGINYASFVQSMFYDLQNHTSLSEIISTLEKKIEEVPQYKEIAEKLKASTSGTMEDFMFKIAFRRSFMKAFIPIYMVSVENTTGTGNKMKVFEAASRRRSFYEQKVSSNFMMRGMPVDYKGKTVNLAIEKDGTWMLDATVIPKLQAYLDERNISKEELVNRQIEVMKGLGFEFVPETIEALKKTNMLGSGYNVKFKYILNHLFDLLGHKSFITDPYKDLKQTPVPKDKIKYSRYGDTQNNTLLDFIQAELKNNKLYNVQNTVTNAEGNTANTVQDHNNFTMVNKLLSDPIAYPTLQSILEKEPNAFWMNPETNVAIRHSLIMNSLFFMDKNDLNYGKRRRVIKDDKIFKYSATEGEFVQLQLMNTGGVQSRKVVNNITESDSASSTGLTDIEKILQDMNSFFAKGYNSVLRLGDKSTDLGYMLNYYVDSKTGEAVKRPFQNQEESSSTIFSNTAFQNYIQGALLDVMALKWLQTKKQFLNDLKMGGKNLSKGYSYLDKVLSDKTKKDLDEVINKAEKIEDLEVLMESVEQAVQKDVITYFENYASDFVKGMKPTLQLANSKNLINNPAFDQAAKFYLANSFIMDLEQMKIFFGDPIFFKAFHKRASKDSATGAFPVAEEMIVDELNNRTYDNSGVGQNTNLGTRMQLRRLLETGQITLDMYMQRMLGTDVTKSFGSAVLEDVMVNNKPQIKKIQENIEKLKKEMFITGKLSDLYDKSLSKVIQDKYMGATEADGQGKCTFDFYRIISMLTKQWTPEQETEYNKIIMYDHFDRLADSTTDENLKAQYIQQRNNVGYDSTVAVYFPPKKFQYSGPQKYEKNIDSEVYSMMTPIFDKFSLQPLIPTITKGTPDDHLQQRMLMNNIGYVKYASGSKVEMPGKLDSIYENYDPNDPGNRVVKPFSPMDMFESKQELFFNHLKEQVTIDAEIHDNTIFGSQIRKLIMMNITRPEMRILYDQYKDLISDTVELEKTSLYQDLGIEKTGDTLKVKDMEKLVNYFLKEIEKKNQSNNVRKALKYDEATGKFEIPLDAAVQAQILEGIIISAINNRLVRYKTNGSMLVQVATTGNEPIRYNSEKSDLALRTFGSQGLKYYDVIERDGKTVVTAMEVKIGLTGQWLKLLELSHPDGFKIGSLERLNEAIKNEEWKNKNRKAITMVAYRIPTQGRNFSDVMEIAEFLPGHFGDAIIMPSEIVVKSGSDFDIDKMFVFYPNLDNKGKYIDYEYGKDMLYQDLEKIKDEAFKELKHLRDYRKMTLSRLRDDFYEAKKKFSRDQSRDTQTRGKLDDLIRQVKIGLALLEAEDKNIKNSMKALALSNEREDGRLDRLIKDSIIFNLDEYNQYKKENNLNVLNPSNWIDTKRRGLEYLLASMTELKNQTLDQSRRDLVEKEEALEDWRSMLNSEIETAERILYRAKNMKANVQNKLYQNMADVILHPANYLELITPSDNFLIMPIIDDLFERLGKGVDAEGKHVKTDYANTDILNRWINAQKFLSLLKSKSDLGIAAVANTFNVLFQRAGAKANPLFFTKGKSFPIETFFTSDSIKKSGLIPTSVDYSDVYDEDGNLKSEFYSEFISAFVDAANDDYVFTVNVVTELSPLMFYMKYEGLSTEKIMYFVNQPGIRRYIKNLMKYDNKFVNTASATDINPRKAALAKTLQELGVNLQTVNRKNIRGYLSKIGLTESSAEYAFTADSLKKGVKPDDAFEKLSPTERGTQIAMLMEMLNLKEQSSSLTELQKAMNFDTKPYSSSFDVYIRDQVNQDGMDGKHVLNRESIEAIRKESMIAPLNVGTEIKFLLQELLPIRNNISFNTVLIETVTALKNDFENPSKAINTTDDQMKFARTAKNDLPGYILQNYLQNNPEGVKFFKETFNTDKPLNEYLLELVTTNKMREELNGIRKFVNYDKLLEVFPIVHNLVMEPGENNEKLTNFRIVQSSNNAIDKDALAFQFEQIVNEDPQGDKDIMKLQAFFKDLALYSMFQSGMNTSDISYTDLTPVDVVNKLYGYAMTEFEKQTGPQRIRAYNDFLRLFKKNNPGFYGSRSQDSITKDISKRGKWYSKETELMFEKKKIKARVKITGDTDSAKAAARNKEGIYSMRPNPGDTIPGVNETQHFGNPWSHKGYQNSIKTESIPEAVKNYEQWLKGEAFQDIEQERRKWILSVIEAGRLDGKTFVYFKPGYRSHANVLVDFINNRENNAAPATNDATPKSESTTVASTTQFIGHSGGAGGADMTWDAEGKPYGVKFKHYYTGVKSDKNAPGGNVDITNFPVAKEGASKVAQAAKVMWGYQYNTMKDERLIRNWAQVVKSDAIFALAPIAKQGDVWSEDVNKPADEQRRIFKSEAVQGGTGYAVEMAIQAGKKVYVYNDPNAKAQSHLPRGWYTWNGSKFEAIETPVLTPNFAGIGSRNISNEARQAIRDVYAKTFGAKSTQPAKSETGVIDTIKIIMSDMPFNWEMSAGQIADMYQKEKLSNESVDEFMKRMSCLGKIK